MVPMALRKRKRGWACGSGRVAACVRGGIGSVPSIT